jgi:plastocyanin
VVVSLVGVDALGAAAPPAGDYFFYCDIHPHAMQGKLVVK